MLVLTSFTLIHYRSQKNVLKDLIVAGDERLQAAMERYDAGDFSALESLMTEGVLNRPCNLDILEDLDFCYMNFDGHQNQQASMSLTKYNIK